MVIRTILGLGCQMEVPARGSCDYSAVQRTDPCWKKEKLDGYLRLQKKSNPSVESFDPFQWGPVIFVSVMCMASLLALGFLVHSSF